MSEVHDIFLRAHTIVVDPHEQKRKRVHTQGSVGKILRRWPKWAVVFDCETRTDSRQELTFGFYRVLKLERDSYVLKEEGAFFADDLPDAGRAVLEGFAKTADTEVRTFPPIFPCYPCSRFVKSVSYIGGTSSFECSHCTPRFNLSIPHRHANTFQPVDS